MRVLFTTFPWTSHFFALVPLAWAFRAAGHEVRVASSPSAQEMVVRSGLTAVEVGEDAGIERLGFEQWKLLMGPQPDWPADWPEHPERLGAEQTAITESIGRLQIGIGAEMAGGLLEFARGWQPDLVVHDAVTFAGPVVASALGVPNVSSLWGTPGLQLIEMRRHGAHPREPLPEYVELFERHGAPLRLEPTAWVDPCAPATRYPTGPNVFQMRFVPYNGGGRLPAWLHAEPKGRRVCVTWGGTPAAALGGTLELVFQCIDAAAATGAEVIAAVPRSVADALRERGLPGNVRPEIGVPLHLLLPTCDAVVFHGGAGTSMTAAVAGTPQLAIAEQPESGGNAARLALAGAARHLRDKDIPAGAAGQALLESELRALLDEPSYRRAAARMRDGIRDQPAPAEVVASLVALAGRA